MTTTRPRTRALLTMDPGLQRTLLAGRVTLSLILGTIAGWLTGRLTGQPVTLTMLAAATGMQTSMAAFGPSGRPRLIVCIYAWITTAAATVLAIAVTPSITARYATFVVVMVIAVWMRRFASYGFGMGMIAFNAFFFPLFMRAKTSQLGWLLLYATLGIAAAALVRMIILPDRPRATMQRLLTALRARCERLTDAEAEGQGDPQRTMREIDEIVVQLHDLLANESAIVSDVQQFEIDLFAVVSLSQLLVLQRSRTPFVAPVTLSPGYADPIALLHSHLREVERAFHDVDTRPVAANTLDSAEVQDVSEVEASNTGRLRDSDRASIQVAIAATLAIAVGSQLSEQRYYWAAMTAFYMFTNVTNRGAGLRRALDRTLGTVGGIAGGLLLSYVLANQPMLELVLLFPVIFAGFWLLKSSYALLTVMITIMLALMYEMMGMLTFGLLLLRLGETFIGAAIAVVAMFFILPSRTSEALQNVYDRYLDEVDRALQVLARMALHRTHAAADPVTGGGEGIDAMRDMGRVMRDLEGAVRPVISAVPGRRARLLRQELVLALTIRYALQRLLARVVFHTTPLDGAGLRDRVEKLRDVLRARRHGASPNAPSGSGSDSPEVAAIARIELLLGELIDSRIQMAGMDAK